MTDSTTITDRMAMMGSPSRKARHNARVRARLLEAATAILQTDGQRAATIDAICKGAGLTRGAFYTHFPSKTAILAAAVRRDPPLLTMLKARSESAPDALWLGMRYTLNAFLKLQEPGGIKILICDPETRADGAGITPTDTVHLEILTELARGAPVPRDHAVFSQVLALAVGAQHTAQVLPPGEMRARTLKATRQVVSQLLDAAESTGAPMKPGSL